MTDHRDQRPFVIVGFSAVELVILIVVAIVILF